MKIDSKPDAAEDRTSHCGPGEDTNIISPPLEVAPLPPARPVDRSLGGPNAHQRSLATGYLQLVKAGSDQT